jgi:CspA family cold shock protein
MAGLGSLICQSGLSQDAMATGTVDFFNDTGGYGFIETEDADEDVFFHMEDIGGPDLEEGQELEFDIEQAPKGPRAKNVTRL